MAVNPNVASFVTGFLRRNREMQDQEAQMAAQEVAEAKKMQRAMALERYKSQMDRYNKDTEMARKLEAAGSGAGFAQVYYSGLAGIPLDQVRQDLDPNTDAGKRNLQWFENEENRKAVLSHLQGTRKPTFNENLQDPDFQDYIRQRRQSADVLTKLYRKGTGQKIRKLPNIMDPAKHEERINSIVPEQAAPSLSESLENLGLRSPQLEMAADGPDRKLSSGRTYYGKDGQAVTAWTVKEAQEFEKQGMSPVAPKDPKAPSGGWNMFYHRTTGESIMLKSDDPRTQMMDPLEWTTAKPPAPKRAISLSPNEAAQVTMFLDQTVKTDIEQYKQFGAIWDEADKDEKPAIQNALYSEIANLRTQSEYMDEGIEALTGIAIQAILPRIQVKGTWYGGDNVIVNPAAVSGEAPPVDQVPSSAPAMPPAPVVKPNEIAMWDRREGKYAIYNQNKQFIRWHEPKENVNAGTTQP